MQVDAKSWLHCIKSNDGNETPLMPATPHDSRHWFADVPDHRRRVFLKSQQQGKYIHCNGRSLLNFSSNDYLGLRQHPEVVHAAQDALASSGLGSGASRLVCGDAPEMHDLEHQLAAWKGYEQCLMVGSGMLANIGLLQALSDRYTLIFSDKLNHASLVDGARLSAARVYRFQHLDVAMLGTLLRQHPAKRRIIVSDGVFSMDGDAANVSALLACAEAEDALLVIDDAHGTGCFGHGFRGITARIAGHPRLLEVGTFGKAFGGYGAFILGTCEMIEGLRQRLRTMMYSTALPVAWIVAMQTSLRLIQTGSLQKTLQENIQYFLQQTPHLHRIPSKTAIQPVMLGSDEAALYAAQDLRDAGFFVPAIRPPTVPEGTARLRVTLSAQHSQADIQALIAALSA